MCKLSHTTVIWSDQLDADKSDIIALVVNKVLGCGVL